MKRSMLLEICVQAEFHTLLLVSLFFLFAGHNQPGGGFAGGLVASAAFCLVYVAGGPERLHRTARVPSHVLMGVGLLLAVVTGITPLVLGHEFLESSIIEVHLPFIGPAKTSSVLFFDTGVYLVVLGMILMLLEQFGAEGDES